MKIIIDGIHVVTIIGCNADERTKSQPLNISLDLELLDCKYLENDAINNTINYDELIDFVKVIIEHSNFYLLESLAEFLALELLNKYHKIAIVNIKIIKLAICGIKADQIQISHTQRRQYKVVLALGSNIGLKKKCIINAIELLSEYLSNIKVGKFYETRPFGELEQENFINTAIIADTSMLPDKLFAKIKAIEKLLGKSEIIENGPRIIDIDLIFFSNWEYQYNFLVIPHQRCYLRDFVLKPVMDIEPDLIHVGYNKTVSELYHTLGDKFIIREV